MISRFLRCLAFAAAAALLPAITQAQTSPAYQTSDADQLAQQMRVLAASPTDVQALTTAGELTLRMGDATAAGVLFSRAERVDPRSARLKADMGSLLLHTERPGEALQLFAKAESLGWPAVRLAPERGLAFDLIGENERAQREYRLALKAGPDSETTRRYALSLGISGQRERAEAVLDPLLRQSDRAAWRDRAFILAMTGDPEGAERIATSMMPGAVATGLAGFFPRLASMAPADRAFAVTFGELVPSAGRLADRGRVPPLAPLGPDPDAPVRVAQVQTQAAPARDDRRHGRRRQAPAAQVAPAPAVTAQAAPPPPARTSSAVLASAERPLAGTPLAGTPPVPVTVAPASRAAETDPRVITAATRPVPAPVQPAGAPPVSPAAGAPSTGRSTVVPRATASATVVPAGVGAGRAGVAGAVQSSAPPAGQTAVQLATAGSVGREDSVLDRIVAGIGVPGHELGVTGASTTSASAAAPTSAPATTSASPPASVVTSRQALVSPIAPPAATTPELAATRPDVCAAPSRARTARCAAAAPAAGEACTVTIARGGRSVARPCTPVEARLAGGNAEQPTDCAVKTAGGRHTARKECLAADAGRLAARSGTPADCAPTRAARGHKTADPRCAIDAAPPPDCTPLRRARGKAPRCTSAAPLAETTDCLPAKRGGRGKAAQACAAPAEGDGGRGDCPPAKGARARHASACRKDPALAEPSRVWVQVAGGASGGDLLKAWNKARAAAPAAFKGRQGWTTPLRATNRVLTGPFDDADAAQTFVNQLAKAGLSGFVFTSEAGQKIVPLATGKADDDGPAEQSRTRTSRGRRKR